MEASATGDEQAQQALCDLVRSRIEFGIVAGMGKRLLSRIDVEDILQETFSVAMEKLPTFEVRGEAPCWAWWRTLAHNQIRRAVSHWSSQRRSPERDRELTQSYQASQTSPSHAVARREEHERALLALRGLPEHDREVLWLTVVEEMSPADAAPLMGISVNNVRVRKFRALDALRAAFDDVGTWEVPTRKPS